MKPNTIAKPAIAFLLTATAGICGGYLLISPNRDEKTGTDKTIEERFTVHEIRRGEYTYAVYCIDGRPVGAERTGSNIRDGEETPAAKATETATMTTPTFQSYPETAVTLREEYEPTEVEIFQTRNETYVVGDAWQVREYLAHCDKSSYQGLFAVSNAEGRPSRLPIIDRRGLNRLRRDQPQGVPSESAMLSHDQTDNLFYAIINK